MGTRSKGLIIGTLTALLGAGFVVSPVGWQLEETVGLDALFQLRGAQPVPPEPVIVSIDRDSSRQLGLAEEPRHWPRRLHAELTRRLHDAGAAVVVFDLVLDRTRNADHEQALAQAMAEAGNVVLFEYLRRDTVRLPPGGAVAQLEQQVAPLPVLAEAAAALAPFPLPKVPARVRQTWTFKSSLGDAPTLPVAALHIFLRNRQPDFWAGFAATARLAGASAGPRALNRDIRALRRRLTADPDAGAELLQRLRGHAETTANAAVVETQLAQRLVDLYSGPEGRYLNYYGPPRSIPTLPYYRVIEAEDTRQLRHRFDGRAVFVGFSEAFQPAQRDGFYTVFSADSGVDISGVEIAATAFANLLHGETIRPFAPAYAALGLCVWGFIIAYGLRAGPLPAMLGLAVVGSLIYLLAAQFLFARFNLWLPLVIPLAMQLPVALLITLIWRYQDVQRERQHIRRAFGFHLPNDVVDRLASGVQNIGDNPEKIYGVCLASDAEQYSSLAESMPPQQLHALLNRYYEQLFAPVRRWHGVVSDVVGDAMLAIWASPEPDPELCLRACRAALEVSRITSAARHRDSGTFATRIGIHCGAISLGHVGAMDHYEYRAVGDIVNTATRIENLAKTLGCRLLLSAEVAQQVPSAIIRDLGWFRLKGKREALQVYELLGLEPEADSRALRARCQSFTEALQRLRARDWHAAQEAFRDYDRRFGPDGPARYYLARIEELGCAAATEWPGVWHMS